MIKSFFLLLTRCYRLALPYGRVKLLAVLGLIFFNGLLQLIGVSSVFPFFALAADPERIRRSPVGIALLNLLPPMDTNQLMIIAGIFAILMLFTASIGSMVSDYLRIKYAFGLCHWLRQRIFASYARQPYSYFLKRNSAEMAQQLWDVQTFIGSVLMPVGEFLSRLVLVMLLLAGVFYVQPWIALGAFLLFGGFYFAVFVWLRPRTRAVGVALKEHEVGFAKNTLQFLNGIKTVFVHDKSRYFMDEAMVHSSQMGKYQSKTPIYSSGPRYLIEPIAFGSLVAIVIILAIQGRPFADILPNLSVMALAAYRLLPALQMLYGQLVNIASYNYTLTKIERELVGLEDRDVLPATVKLQTLPFEREIGLKNITFRYGGASAPVLSEFCLKIGKNESIGIAGPSGSGKSTLVDLMLGLHLPDSGSIHLDDLPITKSEISSWRSMIGYVPQDIYLMDDTIAANIAFGIDPSKIDPLRLREAAQGAQILEFIEKELPEGFQTAVGERGVRLSGGQRQRIGLARALYHNPQILILDEATSALDHNTEAAVMETINSLQGTLTIITIAHRLSTLERCDRIIRLEKGRITSSS